MVRIEMLVWIIAIWHVACMVIAVFLMAFEMIRERWQAPEPDEVEAQD